MLGDSVRRRTQPSGRRPARRPAKTGGILPAWGWRVWVPLLLAAILLPFAVGYAAAVYALFPAPPTAAGGIAVPDLVGRTVQEAGRDLSAAGLGSAEATRLPHPTQPAGTVIAQSPLPGMQLRAGAPVRVAISTGVPRAAVPDVVGFTEGRAAALLQRLGFTVARQIEASEEETGRVIRTNPESGVELALPARVALYVSDGSLILETPPDTGAARWPDVP